MFESSVDRLGWAVAGAGSVEVGQDVGGALDELRACRGTQFDSQCADAFLDAVSAGLLERVTSDVEGSLAFVLR